MIVYEYPFNERIRTLLRLEDLYEKFTFFSQQENAFQHHVALSTIFEMLDVAGRADLKSDLLQELEKQKQTLLSYRSSPHVETEMLNAFIDEIQRISSNLVAFQGKAGQNIRDNEWLTSVRGRTHIPGGTCEFDLPSYYAWQSNSSEQRRQDINAWAAPLIPLFEAINMTLRLLRESGQTTKILSESGVFQQMLQGKTYQLIRVKLDASQNIFPEISANKYMLWVRFMTQDGTLKPRAIETEVPFELTFCNF